MDSTSNKALQQSNVYNSSYPTVVRIVCILFRAKKEMGDLLKFVVPEIQAHWENVAHIALCCDVETVKTIRCKHQSNVKKCCQEMFEIWLTTVHGVKPKTWLTLITQLKTVEELISATEVIENKLKDLKL